MNWQSYISNYDEDTIRLLKISEDFLTMYFGYTRARAADIMERFFNQYRSRYDEDFYHHEGAYRTAAIINYLTGLDGDPNNVGKWLIETGHHDPPREAFEYFRQHYYRK